LGAASSATTHAYKQLKFSCLPKIYAMEGGVKLRIKLELPDAASRVRTAKALLVTLARG